MNNSSDWEIVEQRQHNNRTYALWRRRGEAGEYLYAVAPYYECAGLYINYCLPYDEDWRREARLAWLDVCPEEDAEEPSA